MCARCCQPAKRKDVQVDHIVPVLDPRLGFVNFDVYVARLFCSLENLQVLCKPCHKIKTNQENEVRRYVRRKYKRPSQNRKRKKRS
jgi:5-methylcytosine-specific restriction endonuclease McrA